MVSDVCNKNIDVKGCASRICICISITMNMCICVYVCVCVYIADDGEKTCLLLLCLSCWRRKNRKTNMDVKGCASRICICVFIFVNLYIGVVYVCMCE